METADSQRTLLRFSDSWSLTPLGHLPLNRVGSDQTHPSQRRMVPCISSWATIRLFGRTAMTRSPSLAFATVSKLSAHAISPAVRGPNTGVCIDPKRFG